MPTNLEAGFHSVNSWVSYRYNMLGKYKGATQTESHPTREPCQEWNLHPRLRLWWVVFSMRDSCGTLWRDIYGRDTALAGFILFYDVQALRRHSQLREQTKHT